MKTTARRPSAPLPRRTGKELPDSVRVEMESALGTQFASVRVHEGAYVRRMGAVAMAHGENLHFAPGAYQPHTSQGRAKIAHELTHVVQQRSGRARASRDGEVLHDPALEREAERAGGRVVGGASVASSGAKPQATESKSAAAPVQGIWVRLSDSGKIFYSATKPAPGVAHHDQYFEMDDQAFALWKGAGKRTPSRKVTDPQTRKNYAVDQGEFHEWDSTQGGGLGVKVQGQAQTDLQTRLAAGGLIDRRRPDRTPASSPLLPFDVGTYKKSAVTPDGHVLARPLPTAHRVWPANNDHVPSGQSLRLRNTAPGEAQAAYEQGAVIAIHNPEMHRASSPTLGGRQASRMDTEAGAAHQDPRARRDADHPPRALHRDVFYMLDATAPKTTPTTTSLSSSSLPREIANALDMRNPESRLRQMGAYRKLYRLNVKMNQQIGGGRGVDPSEPAQDFSHTPQSGRRVGRFDYQPQVGTTQGMLMSDEFVRRLKKEGFTQ